MLTNFETLFLSFTSTYQTNEIIEAYDWTVDIKNRIEKSFFSDRINKWNIVLLKTLSSRIRALISTVLNYSRQKFI